MCFCAQYFEFLNTRVEICVQGLIDYSYDLQPRAVNVDLQTDATLQVDISDALSERDKVKFTVHTKVFKNTARGILL